MKTPILVLLSSFVILVSSFPPTARAQAQATLSQEEAVKLYPALTDPDSQFHKLFVQKFQYLKSQSDQRLQRDDWPMMIANEVAGELQVKPKEAAAANPSSTYVNPLSPAANRQHIIVSGKVLQRKTEGIIVETDGGGQNHAKGRVMVRGGTAQEDTEVKLTCVADGTYTYTGTDGAEHVVDAYKPSR